MLRCEKISHTPCDTTIVIFCSFLYIKEKEITFKTAEWDPTVICMKEGIMSDAKYTILRVRYTPKATIICTGPQCAEAKKKAKDHICQHIEELNIVRLEDDNLHAAIMKATNKKCSEEMKYTPKCLATKKIPAFDHLEPPVCPCGGTLVDVEEADYLEVPVLTTTTVEVRNG